MKFQRQKNLLENILKFGMKIFHKHNFQSNKNILNHNHNSNYILIHL